MWPVLYCITQCGKQLWNVCLQCFCPSILQWCRSSTAPYADRVTMYGSNLRFSRVTREDNGVYSCEVSANSQFGEVKVTMTILGKDPFVTNQHVSPICNLHTPKILTVWMLWRLCGASHAENVMSCPAVPPGEPVVRVPSSVTTGRAVTLTCHDPVGSPPSKYNWFKDGVLMPSDPSTIAAFKNATYKLNTETGTLVRCNPLLCTISTESNFQKCNIYPVSLQEFPAAVKMDSAQYSCEAFNGAGPAQRSKAFELLVRKYWFPLRKKRFRLSLRFKILWDAASSAATSRIANRFDCSDCANRNRNALHYRDTFCFHISSCQLSVAAVWVAFICLRYMPWFLTVIQVMNFNLWRFLLEDLNTGGIVAGVIVALLLVVLLVFGIWYAKKKGYLPSE